MAELSAVQDAAISDCELADELFVLAVEAAALAQVSLLTGVPISGGGFVAAVDVGKCD